MCGSFNKYNMEKNPGKGSHDAFQIEHFFTPKKMNLFLVGQSLFGHHNGSNKRHRAKEEQVLGEYLEGIS